MASDDSEDDSIYALALVAAISSAAAILIMCLKIKSTKKSPELLGTVGTVKPLQDSEALENQHLPPPPPPLRRPSPVPVSSPEVPNRTPSRLGAAGERKLPEIPHEESASVGRGSDLYATVGPSTSLNPNEEASDSEEEEEEASEEPRANHPYAKVRKEHPYATVVKTEEMNHDNIQLDPSGGGPQQQQPPVVPQQQQQQQQFFSGDSQDSSKGYTSISVREPLRHIQLESGASCSGSQNNNNRMTYVTVSETSDDMYAAIEDPTYNKSNSDTYAVINLPDDEIDGGGDQEEEEDELRSAHTYSQVDKKAKKSSKKKAAPQPPNFNVDEMYAKVHKNSNTGAANDLPVGGARPRLTRPSPPRWRQQSSSSRDVNYEDYEVSHYDPNNVKAASGTNNGGYETVPDYYNDDDDDHGYELVHKKKDPGYETVRSEPPYAKLENAREEEDDESEEGYETIPGTRRQQRGSQRRDYDPGYESVPSLRSKHSGYLQQQQKNNEGGYETLGNNKEGYETVKNGVDPGYETVKGSREHGYETVRRTDTYKEEEEEEHSYDTVANTSTRNNESDKTTYKSDPLPPTPGQKQEEEDALIHMSVVREFNSSTSSSTVNDSRTSSLVVIEHVNSSAINSSSASAKGGEEKQAVKNNVQEQEQEVEEDDTVNSSDAAINTHIFV